MMLLIGASLGGGLVVLRRALRPEPIDRKLEKYGVVRSRGNRTLHARLVELVQTRARVAGADLAICSATAAEVASRRLLGTLLGGSTPLAFWVATTLIGFDLPVLATISSSLVLGLAGFLLPAIRLRKLARIERRFFRTSLSAFLDLVSIMLAGGAGIETALHAAARVGDGRAFDAISQALDVARTTRQSPWDSLADIGVGYGVSELPELAATVRLGGEHGARMTASLIAKASALRSRELADVEARANEATERMGLPMVLLFLGFLVLLGYPAMTLITSGFEG